MSHLNSNGGFKKRRRGERRVFRFKTFCESGHPAVEFNGPFRDNIRKLIEFASVDHDTNSCTGLKSWSFKLEINRNPLLCISLFIIEEPIEQAASRHCHHCQYVGWGHHMICNERFHFVVPSKERSLVMTVCSSYEGNNNDGMRSNAATTTTGISDVIDLQGHLLHGILHSNGFGHLISINGIENGSKLAGNEIMDLWDRICNGLRARKVSINDVAKKRSMDLRLIHGASFGEPWFGRWGYRFGRGTYGVTQQMYQKAIEAIQNMPLCLLIQHFSNSNQEILLIFSKYQSISTHSLLTLGQMFRFMQELNDRLPHESSLVSDNTGIMAEPTCRWSSKRVEMAIRVIVEALRKAECRWISRQEVRDTARAYIGDTGLLDFVLKSLGNHVVGNYIVRRTVNPVTKVLEYCLEDIPDHDSFSSRDLATNTRCQITKTQLIKDLFYLYKCILKESQLPNTGILSVIPVAARIVLDSKYLIKDYKGEIFRKIEVGVEEKLKILCTVSLRNKEALAPYDLVVLPPQATIRELKKEVERSFRERYWGLKSFIAETVIDMNAKETDLVFGSVETGVGLVVAGRNVDDGIEIDGIFESRNENQNLVIDCLCGAKEDDGERMISCDICEVWQHTRCVQVTITENVPHIFLCNRCEQDIVVFPPLP